MYEIHQTLHGYRDGHRLLESSVPLSPTAERQLLLLSDNSGVLPNPAFDGYVTGYPLKKDALYVLSRTWAAPEMNRPGCVWTHSLLVPNELIVDFVTFSAMGTFHVRPALNGLDRYRRPLVVDDPTGGERILLSDSGSSQLRRLMLDFYQVDKLPVLFDTSSAALAEALIMDVWAQCWPRLRLSLSFCSATTTPRLKESLPLALQAIAAGEPHADHIPPAPAPDWVDTIHQADPVLWHSFLADYAKETVARPRLMQPMAKVYSYLVDEGVKTDDLLETPETVAKVYFYFRDEEDLLTTAKAALSVFGPESKSERLQFALVEKSWDNLRVERDLLILLLSFASKDEPKFHQKILGKFREYAARAPDNGLSVVKAGYANNRAHSKEMLVIWARKVSPQSIPGKLNGPMLLDLIDFRPELLTYPGTWRSLGPLSVSAFADCSESKLTEVRFATKVAKALLTSGMFQEGSDIIRSSGATFFQQVIGELSRLKPRMAEAAVSKWLSILLSNDPAQVSDWVFRNLNLAATMEPKLIRMNLQVFIDRLGEAWESDGEKGDLLDVTLLISALHQKNVRAFFDRAGPRFERVYSRTATGKLSKEALDFLEGMLPDVHSEHRWDTCDRLRQWLLRAFITSGLPPQSLLSMKLSGKVRNDLAKTYLHLRLERKLDSTLDEVLLDEKHRKLVSAKKKKKHGLVSRLLGEE